MIGEDLESAPHEAGHAIRVSTGATAFDQVAQPGNGSRSTTETVGAPGQMFEGVGQGVETVDTRAALTGSLSFHVAGNSGYLGKRTDSGRKQGDHARPDRRAACTSFFFGEGHGECDLGADPASSVATEQHALQS
jgi:hypothetical protein